MLISLLTSVIPLLGSTSHFCSNHIEILSSPDEMRWQAEFGSWALSLTREARNQRVFDGELHLVVIYIAMKPKARLIKNMEKTKKNMNRKGPRNEPWGTPVVTKEGWNRGNGGFIHISRFASSFFNLAVLLKLCLKLISGCWANRLVYVTSDELKLSCF